MSNVRERVYLALPKGAEKDNVPDFISNKYFGDGLEHTWEELEPLLKNPFGGITFWTKKNTGEEVAIIEIDSPSIAKGEMRQVKQEISKHFEADRNISKVWIQIEDIDQPVSDIAVKLYLDKFSNYTKSTTWRELFQIPAVKDKANYKAISGKYFLELPNFIDKIWADVMVEDEEGPFGVYTSANEVLENFEIVQEEDEANKIL